MVVVMVVAVVNSGRGQAGFFYFIFLCVIYCLQV